jgi:hypothetical protein
MMIYPRAPFRASSLCIIGRHYFQKRERERVAEEAEVAGERLRLSRTRVLTFRPRVNAF